MSSTDKTRQKLMASMRKTKKGSTGKEDTAASAGKTTAAKSATRPARKAAAKSGKAGAGEAARDKAKTGSVVTDPYQGGRRVWPD
jgi:hypothetical protein